MDLYIDRDQLVQALARVQGIVERRTVNPALAHVLLSASGDRLRMTATDTMVTLIADYPVRIESEGELSVDAQNFFQIARALPEPTVHLKVSSGNRLTVTCGKARFNILGMAADEYPPLASYDEMANLSVSRDDLRRLIEETVFSISSDENRYGLNGAHMEEITGDDGKARVRIVTTDGSRLSYSEATYDGAFGMGRRMLLPRKAMAQVKKLTEGTGEGEQVWSINFGERSATFRTEGLTLMVRLVDGEFPEYRKVLPAGSSRRIQLPRAAFSDCLRRVGIVASDRNHSVRFAFEPDRLVLTANNVDLGDAREEVPAELVGEPLVTGFNVRYFQDILAATSGDRLELNLGESLDPCLVRLPDRDDCLFVVMPMRLD